MLRILYLLLLSLHPVQSLVSSLVYPSPANSCFMSPFCSWLWSHWICILLVCLCIVCVCVCALEFDIALCPHLKQINKQANKNSCPSFCLQEFAVRTLSGRWETVPQPTRMRPLWVVMKGSASPHIFRQSPQKTPPKFLNFANCELKGLDFLRGPEKFSNLSAH